MGNLLFAVVLAGFGLGFLVGGVQRHRQARRFLAKARRVPGIVLRTHTVRSSDSFEYFPVLRFRTLEGADIETIGQVNSGSFELWKLTGRQVWVLYDPEDPRKARMDTGSGRGLSGAIGLVAVGCVFTLGALALLVSSSI